MTRSTWLVVADSAAVGNLITTAEAVGDPIVAVVVGTHAVASAVAAGGVSRTLWLGEPGTVPSEAFAGAVAELVAAGAPSIVMSASRAADRTLLGAVAARLGAPVITGATQIDVDSGDVVVERTVFGGIAIQRCSAAGPVALVLDGGQEPPRRDAVAIEEHTSEPNGVRVTATVASTAEKVDLPAAKRVVGIGRGLRAQEDLAIVEALATALGAEVACTRPLAEGADWLPKDRYVGISGQTIAPDLYVAAGISGQLQHMAGVRGAKTIVAINKDAAAPVFAGADFGLVGDLYEILPALTAALGGSGRGA